MPTMCSTSCYIANRNKAITEIHFEQLIAIYLIDNSKLLNLEFVD